MNPVPSRSLQPVHPLGRRARVLLSSVYGPYAVDDLESRSDNPMELYHNQVTREQGVFSLRLHHRSFGLMLLKENIEAPCTLLDFPTLEGFESELRKTEYDVVGIGAIIPNLLKVKRMCSMVRSIQPKATILVGGHVANHPELAERVDVDHVVRSEGVAWLRKYLGEDPNQPIRHPAVLSATGGEIMGLPLGGTGKDTAAIVLTSVGCPMGCDFCSTSAMFGGKGSSVQFYRTGDELFEVMSELERKLGARSFFMMDENFLLDRRRALGLLARMESARKPWSLYVFSSANAIRRYSMDELVRLGVSWVWMGLEGRRSNYEKLRGTDTKGLVAELQSNGIKVLGSTIIGLEEHTTETVEDAIDFAIEHATDFHQFMLFTPLPGTPLHARMAERGLLVDEVAAPLPDVHGQNRFNFLHPHLPAGVEGELLRTAFRRDFEVNGPSILRLASTTLRGWRRHKNHGDERVRQRFRAEAAELPIRFAAVAWAAEEYARGRDSALESQARELREAIEVEFGRRATWTAPIAGRYVAHRMRKRERSRRSFEPQTFVEKNRAARVMELASVIDAALSVWEGRSASGSADIVRKRLAAICGVPDPFYGRTREASGDNRSGW
ncbi:MAG: cobalamin B12-binding domain-containing protein [Deltaproteobacteria bacterium]|nr:cobalamin B12-binding domain-containing protein [Deltaproteobacteria bacterium]